MKKYGVLFASMIGMLSGCQESGGGGDNSTGDPDTPPQEPSYLFESGMVRPEFPAYWSAAPIFLYQEPDPITSLKDSEPIYCSVASFSDIDGHLRPGGEYYIADYRSDSFKNTGFFWGPHSLFLSIYKVNNGYQCRGKAGSPTGPEWILSCDVTDETITIPFNVPVWSLATISKITITNGIGDGQLFVAENVHWSEMGNLQQDDYTLSAEWHLPVPCEHVRFECAPPLNCDRY